MADKSDIQTVDQDNEDRTDHPVFRWLTGFLLVSWACFQLAVARFVVMDTVQVRAIHLTFAISLVFLTLPVFRKLKGNVVSRCIDHWVTRLILAIAAAAASLYYVVDQEGIANRAGLPNTADFIMALLLVVLLLEAARRSLGLALTAISVIFSIYVFTAESMPGVFAFKDVSVTKYVSKIVLSTEGIYGVPLYVSAETVFLFVLLGAMLNEMGAGRFFNDMAIALLGRFKGGPAKAAVVSSGLTGLVSGSSIANVVTTGTFTIPLMKKVGYPGRLAAATEVAASTNGQLMPPIMGAAAFIIAEYVNVPYMAVVKAAALPAVVSYLALFYITHLEASKLGMRGLTAEEVPDWRKVLRSGFHFLIPLGVLLYELMVNRRTPKFAAFNGIIALIVVQLVVHAWKSYRARTQLKKAVGEFLIVLGKGMCAGSKSMLTVAMATATAGIVVGLVTMGPGGMIVSVVETLSGGNLILLLVITAIASLILGMGLPTTATYIVMASITVPIIITFSEKAGISPIPAMSAHLFCFYFGILADDTPPVGLAAYTAAAIADSDPIRTGIQGFIYDLRTAVIPFMFVFNPELIMHGVESWWQALLIFATASLGAFAFTNAVQGWFLIKNRYYEIPFLLLASLLFFWPGLGAKLCGLDYAYRYWLYLLAFAIYGGVMLWQRHRRMPVQGKENLPAG